MHRIKYIFAHATCHAMLYEQCKREFVDVSHDSRLECLCNAERLNLSGRLNFYVPCFSSKRLPYVPTNIMPYGKITLLFFCVRIACIFNEWVSQYSAYCGVRPRQPPTVRTFHFYFILALVFSFLISCALREYVHLCMVLRGGRTPGRNESLPSSRRPIHACISASAIRTSK